MLPGAVLEGRTHRLGDVRRRRDSQRSWASPARAACCRTLAARSATEVECPTKARWTTPDTIVLHLPEGATQVRLGLSALETLEIAPIQPEPVSSRPPAEGLTLSFATGSPGGAPVVIGIKPQRSGIVSYEVGVGGATADLTTIILP